LVISLLSMFLLASSFSLVFMPQVTQAGNKISLCSGKSKPEFSARAYR
jgi:hypothetical protein